MDCLVLELPLVEFQGILHISPEGVHECRKSDISFFDRRELWLVLRQINAGHLGWEKDEALAVDD